MIAAGHFNFFAIFFAEPLFSPTDQFLPDKLSPKSAIHDQRRDAAELSRLMKQWQRTQAGYPAHGPILFGNKHLIDRALLKLRRLLRDIPRIHFITGLSEQPRDILTVFGKSNTNIYH